MTSIFIVLRKSFSSSYSSPTRTNNYSIRRFSENLSDADSKVDFCDYNGHFVDEKNTFFGNLLYTIKGPLTIYKILFILLILLKKVSSRNNKKTPTSVEACLGKDTSNLYAL